MHNNLTIFFEIPTKFWLSCPFPDFTKLDLTEAGNYENVLKIGAGI